MNIFEFGSNLGLKKKDTDSEPGVKFLPAWLKENGFHQLLRPENVYTLAPMPYAMEMDPATGVRNTAGIIDYARRQAAMFRQHFNETGFHVVIGGDCSILIGQAIALKQIGNYGLFFLDGHTDFMPPAYSQTGGAAGMDLAICTGHGPEQLINIDGLSPYFREENVWCVGNREYDKGYVAQILNSRIRYYDLLTLRKTGMENCAAQFLRMVEDQALDGFFIHMDADVLHDDLMPAVDSRSADGLLYEELHALLFPLLKSSLARGIEITILDPSLDPDASYTKPFVQHLTGMINGSEQ